MTDNELLESIAKNTGEISEKVARIAKILERDHDIFRHMSAEQTLEAFGNLKGLDSDDVRNQQPKGGVT